MPDGDATFSIEVTGAVPRPESVELFFECDDLDERLS